VEFLKTIIQQPILLTFAIKPMEINASFNRPENTYLKRFHSVLENFSPEQGNKSHEVLFNNQWYCDANGNWKR
jgi:hypothetical protein